MAKISDVVAGQDLGKAGFRLEASMVREYLSAVEDSSELYKEGTLVPPTAIAALGVRAILEELSLPPGTLHAAQELTMHRAAAAEDAVICKARVAQSSERQGWQFVVVEFTIADDEANEILDGRTTLLVPPRDQ